MKFSTRAVWLLLLPMLSGCRPVYDDVSCDASLGEVDFSPVADWAGDWCIDDWRRFTFDDEGRLRLIDPASSFLALDGVDAFNCEAGNWPLVLGESTTKGGRPEGGSFGPNGNGKTRELEQALVTSDNVFLQYRVASPELAEDRLIVFLFEMDATSETLGYYYRDHLEEDGPITFESAREDAEFPTFFYELTRCGP